MKFLAPIIAVIVAAFSGLSPHNSSQPTPTPQQQVQTMKKEYAQVSHPFTLSFTPPMQTVLVNKTLSVTFSLEAHDLPVSGMDITIPIDTSKLDFVSFSDSHSLNSSLINHFDSSTGIFRYSSVDMSTRKLTGKMILGTITLKAKAAGRGMIEPSNFQLTASGYDKAIPTQIIPATYTIR